MIRIENLIKNYKSKSSLREDTIIGPINTEIQAGGITALVGPNGAGKSTLLSMIGRLLPPDAGTVYIDEKNFLKLNPRQAARTVSILRQENHFVTRLNVRQLVGFGRFPYTQGRLTAADEEIISNSIDFLNLKQLEHCFLDELSGGQRQRAYVAMVLAQDTDYVLLDEPLNNLDMQHSVHMMQQLRKAADELNRTVVIVLHDINFAARYADHIIAMQNGQVVVSGETAEIINSKTLSEVFHTEVKVVESEGRKIAVYY